MQKYNYISEQKKTSQIQGVNLLFNLFYADEGIHICRLRLRGGDFGERNCGGKNLVKPSL